METKRDSGEFIYESKLVGSVLGGYPSLPEFYDKPRDVYEQEFKEYIIKSRQYQLDSAKIVMNEIQSRQNHKIHIDTFVTNIDNYWSILQFGPLEIQKMLKMLPELQTLILQIDSKNFGVYLEEKDYALAWATLYKTIFSELAHSKKTLQKFELVLVNGDHVLNDSDKLASGVDQDFVEFLSSLEKVQVLNFHDWFFFQVMMKNIDRIKLDHLVELRVHCGGQVPTAEDFKQLFTSCPNLKRLYIEDNHLGQEGKQVVDEKLAAVFKNHSLEVFHWSNHLSTLSDESLLALAPNIVELHLEKCFLTYKGTCFSPITFNGWKAFFDEAINLQDIQLEMYNDQVDTRTVYIDLVKSLLESSETGARKTLKSVTFYGYERDNIWKNVFEVIPPTKILEAVPGLIGQFFELSFSGGKSCSYDYGKRPLAHGPKFPLIVSKKWIESATSHQMIKSNKLVLTKSILVEDNIDVSDWEKLIMTRNDWTYIEMHRECARKGQFSAQFIEWIAIKCTKLSHFESNLAMAVDINPSHIVTIFQRRESTHFESSCCLSCRCKCRCFSEKMDSYEQTRENEYLLNTTDDKTQLVCNHHVCKCRFDVKTCPPENKLFTMKHILECFGKPPTERTRRRLIWTSQYLSAISSKDLQTMLEFQSLGYKDKKQMMYTLGAPGNILVMTIPKTVLQEFLNFNKITNDQELQRFNQEFKTDFAFVPCDGNQYSAHHPIPLWPRNTKDVNYFIVAFDTFKGSDENI